MDNPLNSATPTPVSREGLAALTPATGMALPWNPGRARGVGAKELYPTASGLWVGHDTNLVGGKQRRKLAFFASPTSAGDRLLGGSGLGPNVQLVSPNGAFRFIMQADGDAVLYSANGVAQWQTRTLRAGSSLRMQLDGNVVLYAPGGTATWHSGTQGNLGAFMVMQDDGNLVIYSATGGPLWNTFAQNARGPDRISASGRLSAGQALIAAQALRVRVPPVT